MATWTEELAAALPGRVLFDDGALGAAAGDLSPVRQMRELRGERLPRPAAVVRPQATADVQAAVRFAGRYGVPLLVRGGGSGVVGALEARGGEIVLDLSTLDAIGPIDEESGLVTAGAGCLLGRLEESLAARRLTVGHYPQSIAEASLGGLVATRSSGQYSARYGHIEDMIAELEVVTGDGEAVRLGRRPRRSLGGCWSLRRRLLLRLWCLGGSDPTCEHYPLLVIRRDVVPGDRDDTVSDLDVPVDDELSGLEGRDGATTLVDHGLEPPAEHVLDAEAEHVVENHPRREESFLQKAVDQLPFLSASDLCRRRQKMSSLLAYGA